MVLPLLLSLLAELTIFGVEAQPCGGLKNVYVCHPGNPTRFDICIGDQKYTMSCPGGLYFNSRTQICDWPKNADCGKSPAGPSPHQKSSPRVHYRKSPTPPTPSSSSPRNPYLQQIQDGQASGQSQNDGRYQSYDSNKQFHSSARQRSWKRPSGFVRNANDPKFRLHGFGRQYQKQQENTVRYQDNKNKNDVNSGYRESPFAYKDRRGINQPASKNAPNFKANAAAAFGQTRDSFKASRNQVSKNYNSGRENAVNVKDNAQDSQAQGSFYKEQNNIINSNQINSVGDKRKDRYTLHHYPWWASKAATPRSLRTKFPPPTKRPLKQFSQKRYRPSRQDSRRRSKVGLAPSYQPAAAPRKYQQQPQPRQVPPQQPVSAAAAKGPPAQPVNAAAATGPKRSKKPRKTGYCKPETCKLPDCRCVGADIPGGLDVKKTPQMVMLTFDDSVNIANYDYFTKLFDVTRFRNPNGCPIKGTFFVSGDATQYHYVEKLHKRGHEIASHSISHRSPTTYWAHAGYDGYVKEIEGMRKKLTKESKVPKDQIKGMRVPFLQVGGDDQYQMLEDYGYLYDTSMVTGHLYKNDHAPIWPFTLDYPPNSKTCSLTPCPTKSYPGLWEVPLIRWYGSNRLACAMPDGCTVGAGRKGTFNFLEDNFKRHYETNRSPVGIFLHASWFRRKDGNLEGLMDFLEKLNDMEDVWVVTVTQVIDWIQNPVPNSQAGSIPSWSCK